MTGGELEVFEEECALLFENLSIAALGNSQP